VELISRSPALVLDAAHTVESMQALVDALETHFPDRPVHGVFGCAADKNVDGLLEVFVPRCRSLTTTAADTPRAADPEKLAKKARLLTNAPVRTVVPPRRAADSALVACAPEDIACVTGSFYVAGAVRDSHMQAL
jgi:dihydrofolate synthase/folylpolyglutamate synthase